MPFETTATPPAIQPKVTIEFAGQMLIQPGENDSGTSHTCEVGVNRFAPNHMLQVLLTVSRPNFPQTTIPLLRGALTADFTVRFEPDAIADFKAFVTGAGTFDRTQTPNNNPPHDFRWAINIRALHPNAKRASGAEPVVRLRTGTLYALNLTHPDLQPRLERPNSEQILLHRIAADMAVSISPPAGKKVILEWEDLGDPFSLELPRVKDTDASTTYTVSFINDPPLGTPTHDEMALYYKVLREQGVRIPDNERWTFEHNPLISTDEIPCMPGILNT